MLRSLYCWAPFHRTPSCYAVGCYRKINGRCPCRLGGCPFLIGRSSPSCLACVGSRSHGSSVTSAISSADARERGGERGVQYSWIGSDAGRTTAVSAGKELARQLLDMRASTGDREVLASPVP